MVVSAYEWSTRAGRRQSRASLVCECAQLAHRWARGANPMTARRPPGIANDPKQRAHLQKQTLGIVAQLVTRLLVMESAVSGPRGDIAARLFGAPCAKTMRIMSSHIVING